MPFVPLQLFGCETLGLKQPVSLDASIDIAPGAGYFADAMPLIKLINEAEAAVLSPNSSYEDATVEYYEAAWPEVNITPGGIKTRTIGGSVGEVAFREYLITHSSSSRQPVYALTTCYLFYLNPGQSISSLLQGTMALPNEPVLILKPLPGSLEQWKFAQPGTQPLMEQCAYINVELIDDVALRDLVDIAITRTYSEAIYAYFKGEPLPAEQEWQAEYLKLFKEDAVIPIIVKGGTQIGWTKPASELEPSQRLTASFSFDGNWDCDRQTVIDPFFRYHGRQPKLAGHPLIAKLLNQSVRCGTVDLIAQNVEHSLTIRRKSKLIDEFFVIQKTGDITHHPLALDPDQHPHRLIVPRPKDDGTIISPDIEFRSDHWLVYLKISNPLGLNVSITGNIPEGLIIEPLSFNGTREVIQFNISDNFPLSVKEARIAFHIEGEDAVESEAFQLDLSFMPFQAIPVSFCKLINTGHTTLMDEQKLSDVCSYANEILGRQTNVYLYPVRQDSTTLSQVEYADGDLGDPIYEHPIGFYDGAEDVWQQMAPTTKLENIKVLFVWDQDLGSSLGATYYPGMGKNCLVIMVDTQPLGSIFSGSVPYIAKILVHEIGHWFAITCILWQRGFDTCTHGDQHFRHGECGDGDYLFNGNIMTKFQDSLFITKEQALVYSGYAHEVLI